MPQVKPYHDKRALVFHFYDNCSVGSRIQAVNSYPGMGGKDACLECQRLSMTDFEGPGLHP